MAAFSSIVSEVYNLTNRPDLVAETETAVKAATLKAHASDFYPKDLFESGVIFDTAAYFQSLAYKQLLPRWRSLKYLRKYDAVGMVAGDFLKVITPEQTLDSYNINKENVVYLAGDMLEIRSNTQLQYILLGCYLHPDVTVDGYNSWISDEHPYTIIYDAARVIFKTIGFDEQATTYEKLVMEQYAELKSSQILANGW